MKVSLIFLVLFSTLAVAQPPPTPTPPAKPQSAEAGELASIDFDSIIGGPLVATINAHMQGAYKTLLYIQALLPRPDGAADSVNPKKDSTGKTVGMVDFPFRTSYKADDKAHGLTKNGEIGFVISVPQIAIVPIPYLAIDLFELNFNVKLSTVSTVSIEKSNEESGKMSADMSIGFGMFKATAHMEGAFTHKTTEKSGSETKREYSLSIRVVAKEPPMPAGLAKILEIYEQGVQKAQGTLDAILASQTTSSTTGGT